MKRIVLGITLCSIAAVVFALVVGTVFLCSMTGARWLGSTLSSALGCEVRIGKVSLQGGAPPYLAVRGIFCSPDNQTRITVETISLFFRPSALFKGMGVPVRVHVERPAFDIYLHDRPSAAGHSVSFEEAQQSVLKNLSKALRRLSGVSAVLTNGGVRIHTKGDTVIGFSSLQGDITLEQTAVCCALVCGSELWSSATVQLSCDISDNASSARAGLAILSLNVDGINPYACRSIAEMLSAQADSLHRILDRVPEEVRPSFSAQASVPLPLSGTWFREIHAEGSITGLTLTVPEAGCRISDAGAAFRLHDGHVELSSVSGRVGNSRVVEGAALWKGLQNGSPDSVVARFMFDLQDIHCLMRFFPQGPAQQELERIGVPLGTITGSFHLQRQAEGYVWNAAIEDFSIRAGYGNLHLPIEVQGGTAVVSRQVVQLQGCSARFGRSTLGRVSVRLGLGDCSTIEVRAGETQIFLEDAAAVLRGFEATRKVADIVPACSGSLFIHDCSLSGPLSHPRKWRIMLQARVDTAAFSLPVTKEPVTLKHANIRVDDNTVAITDTNLEFLDAQIAGGLFIEGYRRGMCGVRFSASGSLGDRTIEHVFISRNLPRQYLVRGPLRMEDVKGRWSPDGEIAVNGTAVYADSGRMVFDMRLSRNAFLLKDLSLQDKDSRCSMGLNLTGDLLSVSWKGIIRKETLDRLFVENRFLGGEVTGDFTATFDEKQPRRSSARGILTLQEASFPLLKVPLTVSRAKITAAGSTVKIESGGLQSGPNSIDIRGIVGMDEQGFTLDGDISCDRVALDAGVVAQGSGSDRGDHEEFWDTPLRGTVRIRIGELAAGRLHFSPFDVDVLFADRSLSVFATDVRLCGIAIPARVVISPGVVDVDVQADTRNLSVSRVVDCVSGERSQLTGRLAVTAHLTGHGSPAELRKDLHGPLSITLSKGRIFKSNLLMEILSFLNVKNLLSVKRLEIARRGFPYREISVSGEVKDENLLIHEAVFDSSSLVVVGQGTVALSDGGLDITAIAMPFQVQDMVVKMVPFIGKVFGRAPVGVPLKITGTMEKAKVRPESPGAVLKKLANVAGRVLKLPLRIIEPVINRANGLLEK